MYPIRYQPFCILILLIILTQLIVACTRGDTITAVTPFDDHATPSASGAFSSITPVPNLGVIPSATPLAHSSFNPATFRLEDTNVEVNRIPGNNIAWSHQGDQLAFTYGSGIWTVPFKQWQITNRVYASESSFDSWGVGLYTNVAWSPDDTKIGFTAAKATGAFTESRRIAVINLPDRSDSFLSDDDAEFVDWSNDNFIAAWRNGLAILEYSSRTWKPASNSLLQDVNSFPRWESAGHLIFPTSIGYSYAYRVNIADWRTDLQQSLPIPINSSETPHPVASPDGKWISWIESQVLAAGPVWSVKVYDRTRQQVFEIANSYSNNTVGWQALTWSPNSQWLAFSAARAQVVPNALPRVTIWLIFIDNPSTQQ